MFMNNGPQPFSNIRLIDFSRVVSGPYATSQLAMLGADVIKIESPEGDEARRMAPTSELSEGSMSPAYRAMGINKRSVALDLKNPDARAAAERLILSADVVIENFRPGVMKRLGLGYELMAKKKPELIWCSISGFGQTGPRADSPAYDVRLQAMSGLMSITGFPDQGPSRAGYAVVDASTGMAAAFAVASALFQREKTGRGQQIDVPMLDTALSHMAPTVAEWTIGGHVPKLAGNQGTSGRPTANAFPCRDGTILLACNTERQFKGLSNVIGMPNLPEDPRFQDWPSRKANENSLREIIEKRFAEYSAVTLEDLLEKAGVPASRVRDIPSAIADSQITHRGLMANVEGGSVVGAPFSFAWGGPSIKTSAPKIGQDTESVLKEVGLSELEIKSAMS